MVENYYAACAKILIQYCSCNFDRVILILIHASRWKWFSHKYILHIYVTRVWWQKLYRKTLACSSYLSFAIDSTSSFFGFSFPFLISIWFCISGKSQEWGTNGGTARSESKAGATWVLPGPGVKVQCVIRTQGTRGVVVPVETALSTRRRAGDTRKRQVVMITTAIMMQMRTHCENNAQCSDGRW